MITSYVLIKLNYNKETTLKLKAFTHCTVEIKILKPENRKNEMIVCEL